jgi:hypothetical protein
MRDHPREGGGLGVRKPWQNERHGDSVNTQHDYEFHLMVPLPWSNSQQVLGHSCRYFYITSPTSQQPRSGPLHHQKAMLRLAATTSLSNRRRAFTSVTYFSFIDTELPPIFVP